MNRSDAIDVRSRERAKWAKPAEIAPQYQHGGRIVVRVKFFGDGDRQKGFASNLRMAPAIADINCFEATLAK